MYNPNTIQPLTRTEWSFFDEGAIRDLSYDAMLRPESSRQSKNKAESSRGQAMAGQAGSVLGKVSASEESNE